MSVSSYRIYKLKKIGSGPGLMTVLVTGPSSYTTGGFDITIPGVTNLSADRCLVNASGGYLAEVVSASGNTVKIKVYHFDYAASSAGPAVEIADGTDLSSVTFTLFIIAD